MTDKQHEIGDAPVDEEYRAKMVAVSRTIDEFFNGPRLPGQERAVGFCLMVFPFGDKEGGRVNYMSNADPADVRVLLKEQLARIEHRLKEGGRA